MIARGPLRGVAVVLRLAGAMGLLFATPAPAVETLPPAAALSPADLAASRLPWPAAAFELRAAALRGPADREEAARLALVRAGIRLDRADFAGAAAAYSKWLRDEPGNRRSEVHLELGKSHLGRGDPRAAQAELHRTRTAFPRAAAGDRAAFWEGEAAWQAQDDAAAGAAFRDVVDGAAGSPLRGQAAYRLGWVEGRQGDHEGAAARFTEAGRLDPDLATPAALQRGWALLEAGKTEDARALFGTVIASRPDSSYAREATIGRAECAYRAGDFPGAAKLFDAAIAAAPDARAKAPLRYSLAWTALKQRQPDRARTLFQAVEREYPADPAAPFAAYRAALCLLDLNRPEDALPELRQVQSRYPTHEVGEWAAYSRGWIHLSRGRYNEAKAAFRDLLDQYPQGKLVAPAKYLTAAALWMERRFKDAEREFLSFADGYGSSGLADAALLWAGWAALLDGRPRDALARLDRMTREAPKSALRPEAAVAEGEAAFTLKDYARASRAYGEAARGTGDARLAGLAGQGWCAFATGEWKAAESSFRAVLAEAPAGRVRDRARLRVADALFNQKRFAEAATEYRKLVTAGEEETGRWAQLELGWCAFRQDQPDEARRQWDQLRRRWPGSAEAPLALEASAETLFSQERYGEAAESFKQLAREATAGSEQAERAALRVGDCRYNAKDYQDAVLAYREFTEKFPKSPRLVEALYGMQWAYLQLGDFEQARTQAREFLTKFPQATLAAEVQMMVAESYVRERKPQEALAQYRALIEKYPDSDLAASARMKSGEALEALGRGAEAEAVYAEFVAASPKSPLAKEAGFRLGLVRYRAGNLAGAVAQFEKTAADATDPRAPDALYNLVLCRKKQGDEAGMDAAVAKLTADFPKTRAASQARLVVAYRLADAGRRAEAQPHFEAVRDAPFLDLAAEATYALADDAASRGEKDKAAELYAKGAAELPKGGEWAVQCAFASADLLGRDGKHAEAIDVFRKVLEMEDATPEWQATACYGIGQRYESLAKPVQARQMYQECLKREPTAEVRAAAEARVAALGGKPPTRGGGAVSPKAKGGKGRPAHARPKPPAKKPAAAKGKKKP